MDLFHFDVSEHFFELGSGLIRGDGGLGTGFFTSLLDLGAGSFPNFATTQYPDADRAHWGGVERSEAAVGFNVFRAYGSEERLGEQLPRRWGRDAASAHG